MKKIIWSVYIIVFLLTSCAPSESAIQTAIAQTQSAQPIPATQPQTVQVTPLAEINLDAVLFQSGDLPTNYISGQIAYQWAFGLPQAVSPDNVIIQKVGLDLDQSFGEDYLMIALYGSNDDLENSYKTIVENFPNKPVSSVEAGDKGTFIYLDATSIRGFVAFIRCKSLVIIDINGPDLNKYIIEAFAQRVDKRLQPLICGSNP